MKRPEFSKARRAVEMTARRAWSSEAQGREGVNEGTASHSAGRPVLGEAGLAWVRTLFIKDTCTEA